MTQQIQDKFNELYPASESGTHNVRKSLYNVFKAGWEACLQAQEKPVSGTRNGFYIPIVESEEGWGSKHDGYMVTFVTPNFTNINGEEAANDVIVLTLGNALKDLENV